MKSDSIVIRICEAEQLLGEYCSPPDIIGFCYMLNHSGYVYKKMFDNW